MSISSNLFSFQTKKNSPGLKAASSYLCFYTDSLWIMFLGNAVVQGQKQATCHSVIVGRGQFCFLLSLPPDGSVPAL